MVIDILDIIIIVNIILGDFNPNEQEIWASDINQDNTINIQDVIMLVQIILNEN